MPDTAGPARAAADLAWLLHTPSLVTAAFWPLADPQRLMRQAPPRWATSQAGCAPRERLGHYAERLLASAFDTLCAARLLAMGWPLREGGRTLGECDFLLETDAGMREHWELAVKFYCYVPGPDTTQHAAHDVLSRFVGPGLADRFDRKLNHLAGHQLRLSRLPAFVAQWGQGWQARLHLPGRLFYPPQRRMDPPRAPLLDAAHARGTWMTRQMWHARQGGAWTEAPAYARLSRAEWLAPVRVEASRALCRAAITTQFEERAVGSPAVPQVLACLAPDAHGMWRESERLMIVDDGWPERAQAVLSKRK